MTSASSITSRTIPVKGGRIPLKGPGSWLADRPLGRLHAGVDIAAADNHEVVAPEAGEGTDARGDLKKEGTPPWSGYDPGIVVIRSADGSRYHLLAHLSRTLRVDQGASVVTGQVVGFVAPEKHHLHWEIRSRRLPPIGTQNVEVSLNPGAWLAGEVQPFAPFGGVPLRCPTVPGPKTPRFCRKGETHG